MDARHPKSVRRRLLLMLYELYMKDPLHMPTPEDLLEDGTASKEDLLSNIYYLHDRGLVEVMRSYSGPMFAAARITADGLDLVENQFELDLWFPAAVNTETEPPTIAWLVERLVEEVDFSPADGEIRKALQRDVQYLRDELARPAHRWRPNVIHAVLDWIEGGVENPAEVLPSLFKLREVLQRVLDT